MKDEKNLQQSLKGCSIEQSRNLADLLREHKMEIKNGQKLGKVLWKTIKNGKGCRLVARLLGLAAAVFFLLPADILRPNRVRRVQREDDVATRGKRVWTA